MKVETFLMRGGDELPPSLCMPKDKERSFALMFGAPGLMDAPERLTALTERLGGIAQVGCSTAGEIFGSRIYDDTLAVALVEFEHTRVRSTAVPIARSDESEAAGRRLGETLLEKDLRAVIVLSDGLCVNGSRLVAGLSAVLPPSVVVTGGLAGDGDRFQRTWVLSDGRPASGHLTAIGLYGDRLRVGHGSQGGWDVFGVERRITRSKDNVLYELDGRPALELYKNYLGERASELPASGLLFPLSIRESAVDPNSMVRTILAVNEADQSLTFAGDLPEGWLAQLMRANFDRLIQGAAEAAQLTRRVGGSAAPALSIAISCVGRRLVLGSRSEEEVEATLDTLPEGTRQIGFYSYGELSPFANGRCDLHNQTMTLTLLSEE